MGEATQTPPAPTREELDALLRAHSVARNMGDRGEHLFFLALEMVLCGAWDDSSGRKKLAKEAIQFLEMYVGEE